MVTPKKQVPTAGFASGTAGNNRISLFIEIIPLRNLIFNIVLHNIFQCDGRDLHLPERFQQLLHRLSIG